MQVLLKRLWVHWNILFVSGSLQKLIQGRGHGFLAMTGSPATIRSAARLALYRSGVASENGK